MSLTKMTMIMSDAVALCAAVRLGIADALGDDETVAGGRERNGTEWESLLS